MVQIGLASVRGVLILHCLGWQEFNETLLRVSFFFVKYIHPNDIGFRIFVYDDINIKKWEMEFLLFHCKFSIVMNITKYIKKF